MAFSNHGRSGKSFHPNGVKSRPWETQKISRVGQHVQGVRRPPPQKEDIKCLKIGERAQTPTVRQHATGGEWEPKDPWSRSSEAVGSHHGTFSDSLGRVDLRSERQRAEEKNTADTLRWDRPRLPPAPAAPPPPPLAPPDAAHAARREVQRRAERAHNAEITEPPHRASKPRTEKGLRAEALARMRHPHVQGGVGGGGGGGGSGGGGGGGGGGGAEGKEFFKPGDWYTPSGPSQKQKLEQAVAELIRRAPGLTPLQAVQRIGLQMDAALNAPNAAAARHFKAQHHGPQNAARV